MARIDNLSNFLTDVATSIKAKTGSTETLTPAEFDTAIASIEGSGTGGITPVGTITITENGDYDVTNYAGATVNVAGSGGTEPTGLIEITENGTHNVSPYAYARVNVEAGVFPEGTLEITENGEHDVTEYAKTNVNVPVGVFPEGELTITTNGVKDVTNYASVNINVAAGATFNSDGFANDSWETIAAISEAGVAASYYHIGDTKTITTTDCTDEGGYYDKDWTARELTLTIVGFYHYPLASDATKRAGIVLMVEDEDIEITGGAQYYGWPGATRLRAWLNGAFMGGLPEDLRSKIKTVKSTTFNGYNDVIATQNDRVFLPSVNEVGENGTASHTVQEGRATETLWFFGDKYKKAVFFKHTDTATYKFWLRSMGSQDHYLSAIQSNGTDTSTITYPATTEKIHIKPLFNV